MRHRVYRFSVRLIAVILAALLLLCLCACAHEEPPTQEGVTYDEARLSEYIRLDAYEGLEIVLESESASRGEAVWRAMLDRAEMLSYPEEQVDYYVEQSRQTYRYYAEKNGWSYEETLQKLGVSEETILLDAREMVKGDLLYRYIAADAGIRVTDEDKERLFDRYVEKFAEDYGYSLDYVKENMTSLIDDAMLYDKTVEHLILRNTFVVVGSGS